MQFKSRTKFFVELGDLLWEVPISDYSFSQSLNQAQLSRNEGAINGNGYTNRTVATENVALDPGNWSVTVPAKYLKTSGSGTGKRSPVAGNHAAVEAPLWGMMLASNDFGTPRSYDTVDITALPDYNQSVWNRNHFSSAHGGTGTQTNYYYNSTHNFVDFYVVGFSGQKQSVRQNYAQDFEWSVVGGSGGSAVHIVNGQSEGAYNSLQRPLVRDTQYDGGPVFFVQSYNYDRRASQDDSNFASAFLLSVYFPVASDGTKTLPGDWINTNGNITISATAKHDAVLKGVNTRVLDTYWQATFREANFEQLLTGNMYFVTDKPVATAVAGTQSANNVLLEEFRKTWGNFVWNTTEGYGVYKQGHVRKINVAHLHHGGSPAIVGNWAIQGWREKNANGNNIYEHKYMIFPSSISRKTTAGTHNFTVNSETGAWTDEAGINYKAPGLRFIFNGTKVTGFSQHSKAPTAGGNPQTIIDGVLQHNGNEHSGFRHGDHLVIAAGTLDDNDRALNTEVRLIVTAIHQGDFYSAAAGARTRVLGVFDGYNDFRNWSQTGNQEWPAQNDLYIESVDGAGNVQPYTQVGTNSESVLVVTEAVTDTSAYAGVNVINLTAVHSTISIGDRVDSSHISALDTVFVTGITTISGSPDHTRITLSDNIVSLPASSAVTFTGFPDKGGLTSDFTWRWHLTGSDTNIIIRDNVHTSSHSGASAKYRIYRSKGKNIGGSAVFKLEDCCVDTASVDIEMDSHTEVTFTGYVKEIHHEAPNFTFASSAPSSPSANDIFYDTDNDQVQIRNSGNTAWRDCFTEGVNDDDNFVINNLANLNLRGLNLREEYPPIAWEMSNFTDPETYNYEAGETGLYYSGLAGTNGMTSNVACRHLWFGSEDFTEGVTSENYAGGMDPLSNNGWLYNYDWALEIDGTTYSGDSFIGIEAWSRTGTHLTTLRGTSSFGKFVIQLNGTSGVSNGQLLFSTATNATYNTAAKLNAADITLIGTPKSATPTSVDHVLKIISANINMSNNLTMVSTNELGKLNKAQSHAAGNRSLTGSFTMYLDEDSAKIRDDIIYDMEQTTFQDKIGSYTFDRGYANPPQYQASLGIGNIAKKPKSVSFVMPQISLNIPTTEVADVFSTTINFQGTQSFYSQQEARGQASSGYLGNALHLFYRG